MIDPIAYHELESTPDTWFMANVSLDGWTGVRWSGRMNKHLEPDEITEFNKVVNEMIKQCPEFTALIKFFRKHGKQIRCEGMDPTLAFLVERPLMTYIIETTGPNLWIEAHRKEK